MQKELEAGSDELDCLMRWHNCAAFICPAEECPPRSLPIPPNYIENLQSRLGKVMKGILPSTLNIIPKTYYQAPIHSQQQEISSCSQEEQLKTSIEGQPDDMMGRYRDGEHNPLERPHASEEEYKVVADDTLHVDQGGGGCFSNRGWDVRRNITSHRSPFQIGNDAATTRNDIRTHRLGGRLPHSSRLRGDPETATTARVSAREEAAISRQQRGATSTEQSKQFDPEG